MMLGQWWALIPTIVGMLVLTTLPAFFWTRAHLRSSLVALAVSPAIVFAVLSLLSFVFDACGIAWERAKVFPVLGLFTLLGAVVWLLAAAKRASGGHLHAGGIVHAIGTRRPLGEKQARVRASTWGMITLGSFLAAMPMLFRADPRLPAQQWDSTFHLNGVWSILHSHSASSFGGLADLYGGREFYYPATWHAFVSLFATPTRVVLTANASSIVLMVIWVVGATALTSILVPSRSAILASPVLAGLLLNMPADNLTMYNQWPNASGLALIPGVFALTILVGRRFAADCELGLPALLRHLPLSFAALFAMLGAISAHPTSAFVLAALLLPALLPASWKLIVSAIRAGARLRTLTLGVFTFLALALPFFALTTDRIRVMGEYPRAGISWGYALSHMFTPAPPFTATLAMSIEIIVQALLVLLGIIALILLSRTSHPLPLWPIASYLVFCFLTFLAYAPIGEFRTFLVAPWYSDARRIMGAQGLTMVPLMALGFHALATFLFQHFSSSRLHGAHIAEESAKKSGALLARWKVDVALGLVLLLVTGLGAYDARAAATDYVYDPDHLGKPGMASRGELAMIRRMQLLIPAEAVVLGDPIAGAAYSEVIGQHHVVFPQLTRVSPQDSPETVLAERFHRIGDDPAVCEAIRSLQVTHFYEDEDGMYYDFRRSSRYPGLYDVDTSTGFELVDEGGTAKLWKITACDLKE